MRTPFGALIIVVIMLLADWYVFQAVRSVQSGAGNRFRFWFNSGYWCISVLAIAGFLLFIFTDRNFLGKELRTYLFAIIACLFLSKLVGSIFFLVDDIRRAIQWIGARLFFFQTGTVTEGQAISRSVFLSWLGLGAGTLLFGSTLYGFLNKYNYQVRRMTMHFPNLPEAFRGMKILQFSDVHSGSFTNHRAVERGVSMIIQEQADLVVFTGDLINNLAAEMKDYRRLFEKIKAPMGVYSIFGNHDYGDYIRWPVNGLTQAQNLQNLAEVHADMGWRLLRNEHVILEKDGNKIPLIGVENWSRVARFPKYGDLQKGYSGTEDYPFKILLSHDPSHWDAEIRPDYPDIDLTLSGHTHGFQFGVEIPGFSWSPIQYVYKEWMGLYEEGTQKLYVNPGFGFIGYPGRVGILPEITVIELV